MTPARIELALLLTGTVLSAQQYVISTIVGGVPPPTPLAAIGAYIGSPTSVASDPAGNLYFTSLHCVFKIDKSGVLTRVAGNSLAGFSGDGGAATNAQLRDPSGVAIDRAGNIFIADAGNQRVRKVSSNGIITTIADANSDPPPADGRPSAEGILFSPLSVALDGAGILFIADAGTHRVLRITPNGRATTIAGGEVIGYAGDGGPATKAQLKHPTGVAVDRAGNVFIADAGNKRVRKISTNGIITTVAGTGDDGDSGDGGPALKAQLTGPIELAVDSIGNLFITDVFIPDQGRVTPEIGKPFGVIRKVSPNGIISRAVGGGSLGDGERANKALCSNPLELRLIALGTFSSQTPRWDRFGKYPPQG
jgi:sugar lactone lactonase YvrE